MGHTYIYAIYIYISHIGFFLSKRKKYFKGLGSTHMSAHRCRASRKRDRLPHLPRRGQGPGPPGGAGAHPAPTCRGERRSGASRSGRGRHHRAVGPAGLHGPQRGGGAADAGAPLGRPAVTRKTAKLYPTQFYQLYREPSDPQTPHTLKKIAGLPMLHKTAFRVHAKCYQRYRLKTAKTCPFG